MFIIHFPRSFAIGDTVDCRINARPSRVTWQDENTLVIEPGDVRSITARHDDGGDLITFVCGDS